MSERIAKDISEVNQNAGRVSEGSRQVKMNSGKLSNLAEMLQQRVENFKVLYE